MDRDQVSKLLAGHWTSNDFLQSVDESKSVFAAREYSSKLFGMVLEEDNLLSDAPYLDGFTEQEGGYGSPIKFNPIRGVFENDMEKLEEYTYLKEPFQIHLEDDNLLRIEYVNDATKESYRKVTDVQTELRKILFEGLYRHAISRERVEFKRNGQLDGIPSVQNFEVIYNFETTGYEFDAVSLLSDKDFPPEPYHFRFDNDTLHLFAITGEFPNYSIDKSAFQLIRTL